MIKASADIELPFGYSLLVIPGVKINDVHVGGLNDYSEELKRLLKLKKISFDINPPKNSEAAYILISDTTLIISLKNIVDTKKEIEKLNIKKEANLIKLKEVKDKLSNLSFLNKAPVNIIEKFKQEAKEIESSIDKIVKIINTIN